MKSELIVQIVHQALDLGLLKLSDVEEVEGKLQNQKTVVLLPNWKKAQLDELVKLGRISQKDVDRLYLEVSKNSATILDDPSEKIPSPTSHIFDLEQLKQGSIDQEDNNLEQDLEHQFPVKNWDRFEFKKLLGYGGMGIVYQAWDVKLGRMVALKFLRNSHGQTSKRFLQEARAQCRIEHPNICKVYEAGEVDDMPYIAMQYIEGKSLRFAYKEMSLEEKIQVIRDIAYAIHAAHRLSIIHRDIKPDNVMITKSEDGKWQPVVMDFGLAKEVGNKGLTETGALMGTPSYMSPEQARGQIHLLDRRTDIYSLGAMFYSILVGKAPFQGSSPIEVVLKVINEEALSVSQIVPSIPTDINTIIMKCLEKDPKQRYESAQLLAQDLQKYLDGEPISIKAASWYAILLKKARKHKALVILSAITVLLVLSLGSISIWTRWQSARKVELERQMAEQAEKIEAMMRFVSLTLPHNIIAERQMAQHEIEVIKRRMAEDGNLAEGPGNYALGRSYLAFFDYEKARQHLELAYKIGFRTPTLEFALGQVLGEFYRRELDSVSQIEDKEIREAQLEKLAQEYLQPIKFHLGNYLSAKSERTTQETAYLQGLLALYNKDYQTALSKAHEAMGQSSWYYEAYCLEGEIYLTQGQEKASVGEYKEAKELFTKAESAFQDATKIGPSNLQARLGLARKCMSVLDSSIYRGEPVQENFEKTLAAVDLVLQLDPNNNQALIIKTNCYGRLGEYQARNGQDPNETMKEAISYAQKVLAYNPQEVKAYRFLGSIYRVLGKYALDHGKDPQALFDLAVNNLQQTIALKPNYSSAYNALGLIYRSKGQYSQKHGENPSQFYDLAAVNFQKAIETNPKDANASSNLGLLYKTSGEYQEESGKDPSHFYDLAAISFQKAIDINPKNPYGYTNLASLYQTRADYEREHGKDPQELFLKAEENLKKALEINPKYTFAYSNFGLLYEVQAEHENEIGKDPRPLLEKATKYFEKVIELNPKHIIASYKLGVICQVRAIYEMEHGEDPNNSFSQALEYFGKALEINPDNVDIYNSFGLVLYYKMHHEIRSNRQPKELFNKALSNYKKSLEINPQQFIPNLYIALLLCRESEWQLNNAQNPTSNIEESQTYLEKALALKPDFEWTYRTQAKIELIAANLAIKQGQEPKFVKAETAIKKAIEIKPNSIPIYCLAAQLAILQAQSAINKQQDPQIFLRNALEMTEKALSLNPNNAEAYAIKASILTLQAKNQAMVLEAKQLFEKALQLNKWLKLEYSFLLSNFK